VPTWSLLPLELRGLLHCNPARQPITSSQRLRPESRFLLRVSLFYAKESYPITIKQNFLFGRFCRRRTPSKSYTDLKFVKRDESVYLIPLLNRRYKFDLQHSKGDRVQYHVPANSAFHISFHATGTVNVTFDTHRLESRRRTETAPRTGPIFTVVVNSLRDLLPATVAEVNNPPGGIRVMPLPGDWRPLPVGITFYRSKSNETWKHTSVRR